MELPATARGRYPEMASCVCLAEGRPVPPEALSVRVMNFGQHWRTPGIVDVDYHVEVPRGFLRDMLARDLPELVADALKFPEDDMPLEAAMRERGWPDADAVPADDTLAVLALRYFAHDILLEWLGDGPPDEEPGHVLNTVDRVGVRDGVCWIEGRARRSQPGVKYQDV